MLFYFNAKWYCKHSVVSRWKNLTGPWSIYGLQCTALCSRMNCKQIHHTLVPRQTFVLTQDYEWESRELNLTVPKTPSVADTGMWPLPLLSFSRHPQALHNCLSASDESREQRAVGENRQASCTVSLTQRTNFYSMKMRQF